jgi:hypothetical protein
METQALKKNLFSGLKEKKGSPTGRSLCEILQGGAGRSAAPSRGTNATDKPSAGTSAKSRNEDKLHLAKKALVWMSQEEAKENKGKQYRNWVQ